MPGDEPTVDRAAGVDPTEAAVVAALMALPQAGSSRLGRLLADRSPAAAWAAVRHGRVGVDVAPSAVREQWRRESGRADLDAVAERLAALHAVATAWDHPAHPPWMRDDVDPAPVAIRRGAGTATDRPHVALIGTRRASAIGREIARELGYGLAAAGVVVVSGLALGVDGAAHAGALAADGAPPLAVVGSGADVVYPAANRATWAAVCRHGTLITEAPLGAPPDAWRFPARNRLIAAASELVVVVESRVAGGSLLTVDQAIRRGVEVMAVPGSLRNPAAEGTNALLAEGCAPVRDTADVLVALGLSGGSTGGGSRPRSEPPQSLGGAASAVLEAMGDGPASVTELHERTEVPVGAVLAAVDELVEEGLVVADGARWRRC